MYAPSSTAQRLITVVVATVVALACGTNYAYSAWSPQFRERMGLSSTQINLIGTAGNFGTYASGIPVGYLVDAKGPRPGMLMGAVALFAGYFPIHRAYAAGEGSMSLPVMAFFSVLTGFGSCSAFQAAIKTSASNFPNHRGTATAFPLSAYGLSAVFFSTLSAMAFRDDTSHFLLLLAVGTSSMIFVSSFFLRIIPHSTSYSSVSRQEAARSSSKLRRTKSGQSSKLSSSETGTQENSPSPPSTPDASVPSSSTAIPEEQHPPNAPADETSSLLASSTNSSISADRQREGDQKVNEPQHNSLYADIRGFGLLRKIEFWQLWVLMGLLTGTGLMTINNIGNDVRALWKYYDDSVRPGFLLRRQALHVSTFSILSFVGRLTSGIGSDILVKKFRMSRLWCLFASSVLFSISQLAATQISHPDRLIIVSSVTGMAYGMLFGVFPSLVSYTFGIGGLAQNWGFMTLAAVWGGYVFNILYGSIYDRNSLASEDGERDCREGLQCYAAAYHVTFYATIVAAIITLWSIWHENRVLAQREAKRASYDRIA